MSKKSGKKVEETKVMSTEEGAKAILEVAPPKAEIKVAEPKKAEEKKAEPKKDTKAKEIKSDEARAKELIAAAKKETFTVKDIEGLFGNVVDGKYIRRHIRAHFVKGGIRLQTSNNGATYAWKADDVNFVKLIGYLANMLAPKAQVAAK
jgi:hypothetical protein